MSDTAELTDLYSTIEEAAQLLDITCSRDKVWPILTAYGDLLPQAVIAFRVASGLRNAGDLDCRFTMLPKDVDPYAVALANGLTAETEHPAGALLSDLKGRFPIECYGIDFGVVDGFKKTWSFFPPNDLQELSKLADVPSMPRSLAEHVDFFARHGLADKVSLIGIDHPHRTANVYFGEAPAECFKRETITTMLRELELPEPSEQMLKLGQEAFGIYVTLSWDSSKIERICFAVMTLDSATLPIRVEPRLERFTRSAAVERRFGYSVTSTADGEYYKLQAYHRWQPQMLKLMLLGSADDPA